MESPPLQEFGKRRPATVTEVAAPPVKRSRHVALLLTGALAVGGGAYTLMPGENCEQKGPGMAGASLPQTETPRPPRSSSSSGSHAGSGGWWSRSSFYGGNSASTPTSSAAGSTEVTRGGFGGFARAIAAHFSGGG